MGLGAPGRAVTCLHFLFSVLHLPLFDNSPSNLPLESCSFLFPSSLHVLLEKLPITLSYDHVTQPQPQ